MGTALLVVDNDELMDPDDDVTIKAMFAADTGLDDNELELA